EFRNTSYAYDNGKNIINNVNYTIAAGQLVYISGPSGSGKSTLMRLLTGTLKNFEGGILIDNQPIKSYNLQSLRIATGILLSSQDIFHATLKENITMGNPLVDIKEMSDYVNKLGLTDFVQSHSAGYDYVLDPSGKKLPKTIRQKILLIRALLGVNRLLLLEEPFENLDEPARKTLVNIIKTKKNCTIIIASNDTSIAKECDAILHLEKYQS
ncbi:MAG: ABC transporter ATP-binding protein, partial [Deinococcales bacterium]|nr:ABC transporter ATP-binding protein [Chitinophagaceae bacterium]